jgi:hypothetical protein
MGVDNDHRPEAFEDEKVERTSKDFDGSGIVP